MTSRNLEGSQQVRDELYRKLPSINDVMHTPELSDLLASHGRPQVISAVRATIESLRHEIAAASHTTETLEQRLASIAQQVEEILHAQPHYSLRPVINATGVILHTNLGRAPLSDAALAHICEVSRDYSNLELDLETGERSRRDIHIENLLLHVLDLGQDDAARMGVVVVNNCAAATFLALNTLAEKREVIVSRGELVEIGGGFRIPEILARSGALLREVGTTNRTRAFDYEEALTEQTALLLRVHQSNFIMQGFVERPTLHELVLLARTVGVPLFEDQGTGLLNSLDSLGVSGEPTLHESVTSGADLVAASGDKLLGGPQCGLLVGRADLITRIRKNPLLRAFRVDKLTYAALEATLFEHQAAGTQSIPLMRMLSASADEIEMRCRKVADRIQSGGATANVVPVESLVGGGTAPTAKLPSFALSLRHATLSASELLNALRHLDPPIIARIVDESVMLDLRTVHPRSDENVARALAQL
jgi:L-seryl-tRNA(Ser) seleniumtransferase